MKELESKWREIVQDWRISGENQRAYSRRSGHSASQFVKYPVFRTVLLHPSGPGVGASCP